MTTENHNRREFLKKSLVTLASVPAAAAAAQALMSSKALAADEKLVDEKDPTANALKYNHAGKKPADYKETRGGVAPKDQSCSNCMLYTKANDKQGKCQMIATGAVAAKGWCTAWQKKA